MPFNLFFNFSEHMVLIEVKLKSVKGSVNTQETENGSQRKIVLIFAGATVTDFALSQKHLQMARAKLQYGRGTMDDDISRIVTSTVTNLRTRKKVRVD